MGAVHGDAASKRAWEPPVLFQNLSCCEINNQWVKFDKNLSSGSISEE